MASALKPDLILIALGNPGWDDLQTLHTLRQALPAVPILALTTNEVLNQEQAALDAGASSVVPKAVPREELIGKLQSLPRTHTPASSSS